MKRFKKSRILFLLIIVLLVFGFYQIVWKPVTNKKSVTTIGSPKTSSQFLETGVNKSFTFEAQSPTEKKKPQEITFTLTSAETKNKIRVQGKDRVAQEGKTYLLLRLELENKTTKKLTFNSADYIRLIAEGDKKFSPDYHNGVIAIDPISVRRDLVSFVVPKEQREFNFLVGELEGDKEEVKIKF